MTVIERLGRRQLLVVTGKGGVGKTVVTAALGTVLAAAGRRVLLLEVDPRENLHQVVGVAPSGGEIVTVGPRLALQNLHALTVIEAIVREHVRVPLLAGRVIGSPVFRHFAEGGPGLKEMAVLAHAVRVLSGEKDPSAPDIDTVILDAPATGHGVSMLSAPRLVSEVITDGPFGRMAQSLTALVADPERTGIVAVTRAEEMPVQEAIELNAALGLHVGRSPELLVVNALYPPFPASGVDARGDDGFLARLWRTRRQANERELARLASAWPGPRVDLPLLPIDRGPALLVELGDRLALGLRADAVPA